MTCKDPADTVDCDGNGKTLADVQAYIDVTIAGGKSTVTGNALAGQFAVIYPNKKKTGITGLFLF